MYEAVYEFEIKPETLDSLVSHWRKISTYMVNQPKGALSSSLYFCTESRSCIIHSRWPSAEIKNANWPLPKETSEELHNSVEAMKSLYQSPVQVYHYSDEELQTYLKSKNAKLYAENISPKKNIIIYNDAGAGPAGVYDIFRSLHETIDLKSCRILIVDGKYFTQANWEESTRLVIMPGGRARPYYDVLGTKWQMQEVKPGQMRRIKEIGEGNKRIINFISQGGNYFGICAGGYYGAKETVFEPGGDLEVLDEGLSLANYTAKGPAYGLDQFRYNSESGARAAKLNGQLSLKDREVYFNGGCIYEPLDSVKDNMNVLLKYADIPGNPAAIIHASFNKGSVILSGVHLEFIPDRHTFLFNKELAEVLSKAHPDNLEIFGQIINLLGIPLNQEMVKKLSYSKPQTEFKRTHFPITESTQDYLRDYANELFQNTEQVVITANEQTKGRGTKNTRWASPPNVNIYATFGVKLSNELRLYFDLLKSPAVMEIMALAVAKTLEDFGLKPQIKWRNDVLINGKKVCGILCEVAPMYRGVAGLIGIGLNVNMAKDICDSLDQPVTSMAVELERELDKEAVFNRLCYYVSHYTNFYLKNGFSSCIPELNQRLAYMGKTIKVTEEFTGGTVEGACMGVDEIGQLKLKLADNQIKLIRWGTILKEKANENDHVVDLVSNIAGGGQLSHIILYPTLMLGFIGSVYGIYSKSRKQALAESSPLGNKDKQSSITEHFNNTKTSGLRKFSTISKCNRFHNTPRSERQSCSAIKNAISSLKNSPFYTPQAPVNQLPKQIGKVMQRVILAIKK